MRKRKWVSSFLENEKEYLIEDFKQLDTDKPVYIEIGMGMGDFITESATLNPDVFYVGLERVEMCVARAIKKAQDAGLTNFKVMLENAENLVEVCGENSVDLIYLHFSDPWPKSRYHKRRLTYMTFLEKYAQVLKKDGILIVKTDNEPFYDDSLTYFEQSKFEMLDSSRNYYVEGEPMTGYQAKFVAEGKPIYYAKYKVNKD